MEIYIDSSKEKNYKFIKNRTEEIVQNIENIISRIRGNVVLAREKGINFNYIDEPMEIVNTQIIADCMEEIEKEEPRFNVDEIKILENQELAKIKIVVIGDVRIDISIAEDVSNLLFLGRRNPMLVDSYMYHADVGLIPFRHSELVDAINPVKYYEYVACGLPVVATDSYELRSFGEPILLATGEKDFAEKIQQGLHMDKPEKEELQNRVRNCSWTKRWDLIRESLKERGKTL